MMTSKNQKELRKKKINDISLLEGNGICFDCDGSPAQWVSINNGIFLCLGCSTEHRGYGYNISFIKSATDNWYFKNIIIDKLKE